MNEIEIIRYTPEAKEKWNMFVRESKNGTFLLDRDYMDYHADRFEDHSLLFFRNGNLHSLLPACRIDDTLVSHAGLTYGGLIMNSRTTTADTLLLFKLLKQYLLDEGFSGFYYKPVPHIYHTLPAEEDLYALFRINATLTVRNVSSVIDLSNRLKFRDIRKSGIRKAKRCGVKIVESDDLNSFWTILSANLLDRHHATPVHTIDEISALKSRFPDNIRLHAALIDGRMIAGTLVFDTPQVLHTQYISASPEGKECGALDLLFATLTDEIYPDKRYFDFGTSNEDRGQKLNESLIYQKEGFGGRAICYDTYSIPLIPC